MFAADRSRHDDLRVRGGDDFAATGPGGHLEAVMQGIYDELRAQGATREQAYSNRTGSRFADIGASEDVLQTLAAGGEVRARERYATLTHDAHTERRGGSLAGAMTK